MLETCYTPEVIEVLLGAQGIQGPQGPQGPQGEPGQAGGITEVNGYTGPIVALTAEDVGAIGSHDPAFTGTATLNGNALLTNSESILGGTY
jgi:hypothetical protein